MLKATSGRRIRVRTELPLRAPAVPKTGVHSDESTVGADEAGDMTITSAPARSTAVDGPPAGRRTMVTLAVIYLGIFAAAMATGSDQSPDADPKKLIAGYDTSNTTMQLTTYAVVIAGAVIVFFGAAL